MSNCNGLGRTRRDFLKAATSAAVVGGIAGCTKAVGRNMPSSEIVGGPDDRQPSLDAYLYAPDNGGEAGGGKIPYMFRPMVAFLEQGATVTWTHAGNKSVLHSVTAFGGMSSDPYLIPEDAKPFNSEAFSGKKDPFKHTFDTKGVYLYYCMPHKFNGMSGALVVGDVGPDDPGWSPAMTAPESEYEILSPAMKQKITKLRNMVKKGREA